MLATALFCHLFWDFWELEAIVILFHDEFCKEKNYFGLYISTSIFMSYFWCLLRRYFACYLLGLLIILRSDAREKETIPAIVFGTVQWSFQCFMANRSFGKFKSFWKSWTNDRKSRLCLRANEIMRKKVKLVTRSHFRSFVLLRNRRISSSHSSQDFWNIVSIIRIMAFFSDTGLSSDKITSKPVSRSTTAILNQIRERSLHGNLFELRAFLDSRSSIFH